MNNDIIAAAVKECFPYEKFFQYQEEFINKILEAFEKYKYVVVESPTGSGKSVIAYTIANVYKKMNKNSFVTVPYKTLQDQYLKDFNDIALVKGVNNYRCAYAYSLNETLSCKESPCRIPKRDTDIYNMHENICVYQGALRKAMYNYLTLFNNAAFLLYKNYTKKFDNRYLTIYDEAHTLESNLMQFISIKINENKELGILIEYLGDNPSDYKENILTMKENLLIEKDRLKILLNKSNNDIKQIKVFNKINDIIKEINFFNNIKDIDDNYVVDYYEGYGKKSLEFKPIKIYDKAENYYFKHSEKVLMMSATINLKSFLSSLGLKEEEVKFFEIPTTFKNPLKRRPCFIDKSVGYLNNRVLNDKLPLLLSRVEDISSNYPNNKGIIHTHTYKIADYIIKKASNCLKKRLISHKGGSLRLGLSREEALKEHITTKKSSILISPMMFEGIDLKYDSGRFNIICKVPYASLVDPQIKKRMEIDPDWYQWQTILKIEQAYGRTTRAVDDWSFTFILDQSFLRLYQYYQEYFSQPFKESLIVLK